MLSWTSLCVHMLGHALSHILSTRMLVNGKQGPFSSTTIIPCYTKNITFVRKNLSSKHILLMLEMIQLSRWKACLPGPICHFLGEYLKPLWLSRWHLWNCSNMLLTKLVLFFGLILILMWKYIKYISKNSLWSVWESPSWTGSGFGPCSASHLMIRRSFLESNGKWMGQQCEQTLPVVCCCRGLWDGSQIL